MSLLTTARNLRKPTITKNLITFTYHHHYYEMNFFTEPAKIIVVEVEAEDTESKIDMPPFIPLSAVTEVTSDPTFSSFHQARLEDGVPNSRS